MPNLQDDFINDTSNESRDKPGIFVGLNVINNVELVEFYRLQGITILSPSELHCTVAYSRTYFEHKPDYSSTIVKPDEMEDRLSTLGENCLVLKFNNKELQDRHKVTIEEGAMYDYPTYQPHITLRYSGTSVDLEKVKKPDFEIMLGNEMTNELNENYVEENNKPY